MTGGTYVGSGTALAAPDEAAPPPPASEPEPQAASTPLIGTSAAARPAPLSRLLRLTPSFEAENPDRFLIPMICSFVF